ncbi:hypothetical protein YC2023_041382 [Brassica napus]
MRTVKKDARESSFKFVAKRCRVLSCQTHPPQLPQFTEIFERFQLLEYLQCEAICHVCQRSTLTSVRRWSCEEENRKKKKLIDHDSGD